MNPDLRFSYSATCFTSTAYRYVNPDWTETENQKVYGSMSSAEGMGCNFRLDAKANSESAWAENDFVKWRAEVKKASLSVDHKFLNDDVPEFRSRVPTLELVALFLYDQLKAHSSSLAIRLWEGRDRWVEVAKDQIRYGESCRISCVHKHWNPELSEAENQKLYGKCAGLHGHEYRIEATITGPFDQRAQWLFSRDEMRAILQTKIEKPFSGAFLNEHLGNTSGEKIALQFFDILKDEFQGKRLHRVGIFETRKNSFFAGAEPF